MQPKGNTHSPKDPWLPHQHQLQHTLSWHDCTSAGQLDRISLMLGSFSCWGNICTILELSLVLQSLTSSANCATCYQLITSCHLSSHSQCNLVTHGLRLYLWLYLAERRHSHAHIHVHAHVLDFCGFQRGHVISAIPPIFHSECKCTWRLPLPLLGKCYF